MAPSHRYTRSAKLLWVRRQLLHILLIGIAVGPAFCQDGQPTNGSKPATDISAIQHFVFIVKENRTYDNLFGTFVGANGATSGTISTGQVIPLGHNPDAMPRDIGHGWVESLTGTDYGRMDKFDAINSVLNGTSQACSVNGDYLCYTQLTQTDIPNYFTYASKFVLADNAFSSMRSASFPNHLYTVAATAGGAISNPINANSIWGCDAPPTIIVTVLDSQGHASSQYPCFDFPTLADSLGAAGLSWKYYAPASGQPGYEWSALDAINHIRNTSLWTQHVVPATQFITDALAGNLPAVSWVVTDDNESDHPPASACVGENWTVNQINAVMQGPNWNSTLIVLAWDDFGGFYDHVPPPATDQFGLGLRTPIVLISPYSRSGYVSHTLYEFSSFLKTVEERFALPFLTQRDSNANDFLDSLDFSQTPLSPVILTPRSCPLVTANGLDFPPQKVGTTSPSKTVSIADWRTTQLTISSVTIAGDYTVGSSCSGKKLNPNGTCKLTVAFAPTATGLRTGTLTVTDTDPSSPQQVTLKGTGTYVTLSPTLLSFGPKVVGKASNTMNATLSNSSASTLGISSLVASSSEYTQTNTCGSSVAPGGSCTITVKFIPATTGVRYGTITVNDGDGGSPHILNLTGVGSFITLSTGKLTFANTQVGFSSAVQTATVTNKGVGGALSISAINIQDIGYDNISDYLQTNTCGSSLAAGASCSLTVTFKPQLSGNRNGTLQIFHSEPGTSPLVVNLVGTALAGPLVSLTPTTMSFPNQNVGTSSASQNITLMNSGSAGLNIANIASTGDFSQTNNCPVTLNAGASCTLMAVFSPTAQGTRTGSINLTDNAGNSPQSTALSATGVAPAVSLSSSALDFGNQSLGNTSNPQTSTLTNTGTGDLYISGVTSSNPDFAESNNCPAVLAAAASCNISVTFTPTRSGAESASVSISDNAIGSPQSIAVSGTGTVAAVSLSAAALDFGLQPVGIASDPQIVQLTNTGTANLTIQAISTNNPDFAESDNCLGVVAPGASCSISINFTPSQVGAEGAVISITDNAPNSPQMITTTGSGS